MYAVDRGLRTLHWMRLAGLAVVGVLAFAGSSQPAKALQECSDTFFACMTATDCAELEDDDCEDDGCLGVVGCEEGSEYDCEGATSTALVCVMEPE